MEQEKKSNYGGKREGAGRPKGAKQKTPLKSETAYECVYSVRCSFAQREKLKAFWQTIKNEGE